ncbi:MAG: hypothetical protein LIO46_06330 [Clostridiales bacterium]|nr:hypothetical protein [Clostridiales bacterium]
MADSTAQAMLDYLRRCPLLEEGMISCDYLDESIRYAIKTLPAETLVKTYTDQSALHRLDFLFYSQEPDEETVLQSLLNSKFYEDFSSWIRTQARQGILPQLPEGKTAVWLEPVTAGHIIQTGQQSMRYQIQLRLHYNNRRNYHV